MLLADRGRTHVDPKLDRSFLLLAVPREHRVIRMAKHWIGDIGCYRRRFKEPRCSRDPD
jgi:hypothetical protein